MRAQVEWNSEPAVTQIPHFNHQQFINKRKRKLTCLLTTIQEDRCSRTFNKY